MFRVTLACDRVPVGAGEAAARDIQQEFRQHRTHQQNVVCTYANGALVLTAENDFDRDGFALMDEFSDCIHAYMEDLPSGEIRLVEVVCL